MILDRLFPIESGMGIVCDGERPFCVSPFADDLRQGAFDDTETL